MFKRFALVGLAFLTLLSSLHARPNVLLITADDLNCDSVGVFGSTLAETTPRLDALAAEGMRFERAHVTIAVCQPLRSVLMTGRYPHRSGGEGFPQTPPSWYSDPSRTASRSRLCGGHLGKWGIQRPMPNSRGIWRWISRTRGLDAVLRLRETDSGVSETSEEGKEAVLSDGEHA